MRCIQNVIQAREKGNDIYELRIRDETTRLDNLFFNPDAVIEPPRRKGEIASYRYRHCSTHFE
ncbi:uncharacterized protein ACN427_001917 isoform 1-T2 [Glossina fuscipes fuscipes]